MRRVLGRLLKIVVGLAAMLVVLLGGSIAVDAALGTNRVEAVTNTRIPNRNGPEVRAWVARPDAPGPHPAVIMIHEFYGLNQEIVDKARALADEGYVVVAPDVFRGSTTGWIPRAIFQVVTHPPAEVDADVAAVFDWLAAQPDVKPDRIGILGFCFGGGTALRYSLENNRLAATAVFYGSPITDPKKLQALPGPVLGIFGTADASIPVDEVKAFDAALEQARVPHQISLYEGQPHAFVTSIQAIRQGGPQGQAWNEMLAFFKANLQGSQTFRRQVTSIYAEDMPGPRYWLMLALAHTGQTGHSH